MHLKFGDALEIRPARLGDLDRVADVWLESASRMDGASAELPSRHELRQRIDRELASGWALHVALHEGVVIGLLALKPAGTTIDQLFVLPADQGRGVGRALLDLAKRILPGGFTLRTASSNTRGRRFYEREGLRIHERRGSSPPRHPSLLL